MARRDVTAIEVLDSVLLRLRDQLKLDEAHCYDTIRPDVFCIPPGGNYWVTVSWGGGSFDDAMQVGGGQEQTTHDAHVFVSVYTKIALDKTGNDHKLLTEKNRGLLELERKVLKALVAADLTVTDGSTFLRQFVPVLQDDPPVYNTDKQVGTITLHFGVSFDWDLS